MRRLPPHLYEHRVLYYIVFVTTISLALQIMLAWR